MNETARLRNPWNSCGPEVSQKPKNDENDNEKFEHDRFLSFAVRNNWQIGTNENRHHGENVQPMRNPGPYPRLPSVT
jgi:hypothetical protein